MQPPASRQTGRKRAENIQCLEIVRNQAGINQELRWYDVAVSPTKQQHTVLRHQPREAPESQTTLKHSSCRCSLVSLLEAAVQGHELSTQEPRLLHVELALRLEAGRARPR